MNPYDRQGKKDEQVRRMFDTIAPAYDRLNHIMSLGIDKAWRRHTVGMVAAGSHRRVLDLATGTGDLAIAMARRCPQAEIVGADLSEGMLEIGRAKVERKGLSGRITMRAAQAERLPFDDGEFDAVTIAFGIRNFDDIPGALCEIMRVLSPGGRLYILEFSRPKGSLFASLFRFYFHRIVPFTGGVISGDRKAYTYLPQSVDEFPDCVRFMDMLARAGFTDRISVGLTAGVAYIYQATKPQTTDEK